MLMELLGSVSSVIKSKLRETANIDNAVFKLHYRLTTSCLLVFCLLITANQLIGDPINCLTDPETIPDNVINTYCWIHTTFSVSKHFGGKMGSEVPYHGVGPHLQDADNVVYRAYYQWVPFVLFLQAMMFYAPHWLWKMWEAGKLNSILDGMLTPLMSAEDRKEKVDLLVDYIARSLHTNNMYAIRFYICEGFNFANVVGNIYFIDRFLGGAFLTFGTDVLTFSEMEPEDRTDPMILLFPRVTKCTFHTYGPSGTVQIHDSLCILALNILNEKIYIALWFWLIILAVITAVFLLYRASTVLFPVCRLYVLKAKTNLKPGHNELKVILDSSDFGDYYLLYSLGRNLDALLFNEVLTELAKRLSRKPRRSGDGLPLLAPKET